MPQDDDFTYVSDSEPSQQIRVVAGLIRKDGKVLLSQRWPRRHLARTWEFPGGKVEPGENDQEALHRELMEELGVEVEVGSRCFETIHQYGTRGIRLLVYRCRLTSGEPRAVDVKAIEWVDQKALLSREFPPADLPLVRGLVDGMVLEDPDWDDNRQASDAPGAK